MLASSLNRVQRSFWIFTTAVPRECINSTSCPPRKCKFREQKRPANTSLVASVGIFTLCVDKRSSCNKNKSKESNLIKLMDKLIEDLNLTAFERNGENLSKVSLSPDHSTSPLNLPLDDEFYCVDGRLNHHLTRGRLRSVHVTFANEVIYISWMEKLIRMSACGWKEIENSMIHQHVQLHASTALTHFHFHF